VEPSSFVVSSVLLVSLDLLARKHGLSYL